MPYHSSMALSFKCDECGEYFQNIYSADNSFNRYVCRQHLSSQRVAQLHQYDLELEQSKRRERRQDIAKGKLVFIKEERKGKPVKDKSWGYQHPTKGGN